MRSRETLERPFGLRHLRGRLRALRHDASGATMIEYTLAASVLAVTVFASMGVLTGAVTKVYATITTAFGQVQ